MTEPEHWNADVLGPLCEAAMRAELERRGYSVACYVYPPGTCFPEHAHKADKIDGVLAGRFQLVLEGRMIVLEAGDMVAVPRGALHSAAVLGNEPVVSLDAVKR
jgi:quercetin dioxygenase-like cupin family protein